MKWIRVTKYFKTNRFAITEQDMVKITYHESNLGFIFKKDNKVYLAHDFNEMASFMLGLNRLAFFSKSRIKDAKDWLERKYHIAY